MGGFVRKITGADKAAREARQGAAMSAEAQKEGAEISAQYQKDALDYLKEKESIPRMFAEGAMGHLGGIFGLPGGTDMSRIMAGLDRVPYADYDLEGEEARAMQKAEEAILRNASATGGLRSGNVQDALAETAIDLSLATGRNRADLQNQKYAQGLSMLQGLAGAPTLAPQIAQATAGIGQTLGSGVTGAGNALAQGRIASGQAKASGQMGVMTGLMNMGAAAFSDARLKDNVKPAGERNGHKWYTWNWNQEAAELGLIGPDEGVMAHEIMDSSPEAVTKHGDYLIVDYRAIGVQ